MNDKIYGNIYKYLKYIFEYMKCVYFYKRF